MKIWGALAMGCNEDEWATTCETKSATANPMLQWDLTVEVELWSIAGPRDSGPEERSFVTKLGYRVFEAPGDLMAFVEGNEA